jgi:hypothetical protein
VATAAVAQAPSAPAPDVLVFTNGDQLTGHLERAAAGSAVFKIDMAGELTIPFDKIKELRSSGSFSLLKKGPPSRSNLVGQGQLAVESGNVTVTSILQPAQPPATLPVKDVGYVVDTSTYDRQLHHGVGFLHGWNGSVTAGATFVRSTDNNNLYTAGITLARLSPTVSYLPARNRTTFDLIETYGTASSKVIPPPPPSNPPLATYQDTKTSIFHADAERDEYFSPRLYALANTDLDHNFAQGLSLQQLYGGGLGWTVFNTPRHELDLKGDVHYERQNFFTSPQLNLIGSLFSETYRRTLAAKIALTESGTFDPAWNDANAYSAMATVGMVLPTWKRLGVNFNVTDNYLNNPSEYYKKNTFQFVAGFHYVLK